MADRPALPLWRKLLKNPLSGFLLGMGIVGLFLFIIYAIPTYLEPQLSEETTFLSEHFTFHYLKSSPVATDIEQRATRFERQYADLLTTMRLDGEFLSETIHVFLHPHIASVRGAILKRHDPQTIDLYLAVIDVVYDESPRPTLVELLATFALGTPSSRILKTGLDVYLGHPEIDVYAHAAAMDENDFLSLSQMRLLERRRHFQPTLYESFNAPDAPVAINLNQLSRLLRSDDRDPLQETLRIESGALVRYLVETRGWSEFHRLWRGSDFESDLENGYGLSFADINAAWQAHLRDVGPTLPTYPSLRGGALAAKGKFKEARSWLQRATEISPKTDPATQQPARIQLAALASVEGQWDVARRWLDPLDPTEKDVASVLQRLTTFQSWSTIETDHLRFHVDSSISEEMNAQPTQAETKWREVQTRLQLSEEALPDKITVFIYADQAARAALDIEPISDPFRGVFHLIEGEPLLPRVIEALINGLKPPSNSQFLHQGLLEALLHPEGSLRQARTFLSNQSWIPLAGLSFEGTTLQKARVEAAAVVAYVLDSYGISSFKKLWASTSPLAENLSFYSAVEREFGITIEQLERDVISFLQNE